MVEEKLDQIGAPRDFISDEFFAYPGLNDTWADTLSNIWVLNGKAAFPGRCKIDLNPLLTNRRIYAYVWSRAVSDPATNFCFMACQLTFSYKGKPLKVLPLTFTLGTMPSQSVLGKSLYTGVLAGGTANDSAVAVTLYTPNQLGGFNVEPTTPVLLQPYPINFKCDKVTLDVLGWANVNPDQSRFILLSDSP